MGETRSILDGIVKGIDAVLNGLGDKDNQDIDDVHF